MDTIVVAIPCFNEEVTISRVVSDFHKELPLAKILVFDNASTDQSASRAREAGAEVICVPARGKGRVMRAIFDHVNSNFAIVVDGDGTYDATDVHFLLKPLLQNEADIVVGNRLGTDNRHAHFYLNRMGNFLIVRIINTIFGTQFNDVLSGYRAFNTRALQTIPLLTPGFETETELTIQALEEGLVISEIPIHYQHRPQNSTSKLRPFRDGWRIILTIAMLLRDHYPLRLYGASACIFWILSLSAWIGRRRLPIGPAEQIMLVGVLAALGLIFGGIGLVLSAVNTRLREMKQILLRKQNSSSGK